MLFEIEPHSSFYPKKIQRRKLKVDFHSTKPSCTGPSMKARSHIFSKHQYQIFWSMTLKKQFLVKSETASENFYKTMIIHSLHSLFIFRAKSIVWQIYVCMYNCHADAECKFHNLRMKVNVLSVLLNQMLMFNFVQDQKINFVQSRGSRR